MTPFSWEHMSTVFVAGFGGALLIDACECGSWWASLGSIEGIAFIALAFRCALGSSRKVKP